MNTAPLATDSLDTWLDYWSHVHVTRIDLGLERVIPVAEKLGVINPEAKVLTVAGTNGKGSTTTTLAAIPMLRVLKSDCISLLTYIALMNG